MDILIFVEGPQKGQRFPIERDQITLGRDRRNDIPIDDSGSSRTHARIVRATAGLVLRDEGSTNGTYVNSRRVREVVLRHGDRIGIGDTVMLVETAPAEENPKVLVSDVIHDRGKDVTVEMDSTILLQAQAQATELGMQAQQQIVQLFNFMTTVGGVLVMDRLLPLALTEICKTLKADAGAVLFLGPADDLRPRALWPDRNNGLVVSRTIADSVLRSRQGLLTAPGRSEERMKQTLSISTRDVNSVLCVPLVVEDRVPGMIYLETRGTSRPFAEPALRMLSCMAMQLAVTVQNADMYRSLRNAEEFSSCILRSMNSGLLVVDARGVVVRANDAACRILEIEQKELVGLPVQDEPSLREIAVMVGQTRANGIPLERNEIVSLVGNREVPLGVSTSVLEDYAGHASGVVVVFRDLTRLRRLAEEVRRSQRLASLGEMAAGIAHEVRNPLNSVQGFAQLLQESARGRGDQGDTEYATIIQEEVQRINRIVQDLLDFSRQQELTMSSLPLREKLEHLVKVLQPEAAMLQVKLEFAAPPEERPVILGNADKLNQMFMNIIRNGMQACQEGGRVEIDLAHGQDPGNVYPEAIVSIRDNGCGIRPDDLEKIFNPFFTTKDVGTGLGLSICQKIVEHHAGRITVESQPDQGTTFRIHLPMREM